MESKYRITIKEIATDEELMGGVECDGLMVVGMKNRRPDGSFEAFEVCLHGCRGLDVVDALVGHDILRNVAIVAGERAIKIKRKQILKKI